MLRTHGAKHQVIHSAKANRGLCAWRWRRGLFAGGLTLVLMVGLVQATCAQTVAPPSLRPVPGKPAATHVEFVLLTGPEGVGLRAHRWSDILAAQNVTLTIRRASPADEVGVSERKSAGGVRQVQVIGKIDRLGRIQVNERLFSEGDVGKLSEWIKELKTHGAQGSPAGQMLWGLSKPQFCELFGALSRPVTESTDGIPLGDVLQKLTSRRAYPLQMSREIAVRVSDPATHAIQNVRGLSEGTALAILLNEQGLGLYPQRNSNGSIQLDVRTLAQGDEAWPVGWPPKQGGATAAPKLYKFVEVDLEDQPLLEILGAVGEATGVPVFVNRDGFRAKEVDLATVRVSHPTARTTWSQALKTLAFKAKGKSDVFVDEAGKPLVWISPLGVSRKVFGAGE